MSGRRAGNEFEVGPDQFDWGMVCVTTCGVWSLNSDFPLFANIRKHPAKATATKATAMKRVTNLLLFALAIVHFPVLALYPDLMPV